MRNIFFIKSLGVVLILLFASFLVPLSNGNILKTKDFGYTRTNDYNCFSENPKNNVGLGDSIFLITDKFGYHRYSFSDAAPNNSIDNVQDLNIKKIERKNDFYLKNNLIYKDNNPNKKEAQKIFLSGNIFYVGGVGPNNYSSIQDAINDSTNGDTIFVYDDSSPYYENLTINKSINLIGENKNTTEINGSNIDDFLDTINITSNNVYINGFSIDYNPGYYYQAAINVLGDNATITNCKVYSNNWIGISLSGSKNSNIFGCELFDNLMAIHLVDSDENEINSCYCHDNGDDILLFENSNYNKIISCICTGNSYSGIHVQRSTGNQIINCSCTNGNGGIGLSAAPDTKILGNTMDNNYENFGIGSSILSDFYCEIDTSNKINGKPIYFWIDHHDEQIPSDAGFVGLVSCTNISVKNLQLNNNFQGIVLAGCSNCTINECNFSNNDGHGIFTISSNNSIISNCSYINSFFSGIYFVSQSNDNIIFNNNISEIQVCGLWVEDSINNKFLNNTIKSWSRGILLDGSGNSVLKNNDMDSCGVVLEGDNLSDYTCDIETSNKVNNKILYYFFNQENLDVPFDAGEVILVNCTKCNVTDLDLSNGTTGLELAFSSLNNISNNIINQNKLVAIDLDCSDNNYNIITQNIIFDNNYAIDVDFSNHNTISDNIIQNNGVGLSFDSCNYNIVSGNDIKNSYNGMYLESSSNNNLDENILTDCDFSGIYLLYSKNNDLKNNYLYNCGLIVYGQTYSEYINNVDTSNKINGKIIYYYINQNNINDFYNAGEIILVKCNNCNITNLDLSNGIVGVELAYSNNITISKNILNNNKFAGVYIESSNNNFVERNTIKNNGYAIALQLADFNKIKNNIINQNYYGCYIYLSDSNVLTDNKFIYNNYGIVLNYPSLSNSIYHNNLVDNGINAWDENEDTNYWYYAKKGNYWSDYKKLYPDAKKILLKGIWDTAYSIPNKDNLDKYPLIKPIILSKEKIERKIFLRFLDNIFSFFLFFNNNLL